MIDVVCDLRDLIPQINAEISQEHNLNANTRLFITKHLTVAKIWVKDKEAMEKNMANLVFICNTFMVRQQPCSKCMCAKVF